MTQPPVFILVHGSFMGGWVWRPLIRIMRSLGLEGEAPTLSGMADRAGAGGGRTGLHAHAADIAAYIDFHDADKVRLVGHSYGCAVAAEAAALRPDRVDHVILIDGFIVPPGQGIFDRHPDLAAMFATLERDAADPDLLLPPPFDPFAMPEGAHTDRILALHRPMSVRTHQEPARHNVHDLPCRKSYLRFAGFPFFEPTATEAREEGWQYAEVEGAGHMGIVTHVSEVATALRHLTARD